MEIFVGVWTGLKYKRQGYLFYFGGKKQDCTTLNIVNCFSRLSRLKHHRSDNNDAVREETSQPLVAHGSLRSTTVTANCYRSPFTARTTTDHARVHCLPFLSNLCLAPNKIQGQGPTAGVANNVGATSTASVRRPSATLAFVLIAQIQFLATLSLVDNTGARDSTLSDFADNLR